MEKTIILSATDKGIIPGTLLLYITRPCPHFSSQVNLGAVDILSDSTENPCVVRHAMSCHVLTSRCHGK